MDQSSKHVEALTKNCLKKLSKTDYTTVIQNKKYCQNGGIMEISPTIRLVNLRYL